MPDGLHGSREDHNLSWLHHRLCWWAESFVRQIHKQVLQIQQHRNLSQFFRHRHKLHIRKEVQDENFRLEENVQLGMLPEFELLKNQATSEIVGSGRLLLDRTGLTYTGTKKGEPFSFHIDIVGLPTYGMCTDLSRFYTFLNGEFVEFYPDNRVVEKFFLATEEIHRLNGGKWKAFEWETAAK